MPALSSSPANPPKISALAAYCRGALARYKVPVEFKLVESVPLGRLGRVEDVAQAVLFLCSPQAAYITGSTLHVNGGMYMD